MAFADADEAARQRFGEQRARNSGWDEMTFNCANPQDVRFRDFGILSRYRKAFNPEELTLSTPCVLRNTDGRHREKAHPSVAFEFDSPRLQFKVPQSYRDGVNEQGADRRRLTMSITKAAALQFGRRLDPRWLRDPEVEAFILAGVNRRATDMIELSGKVQGDHVCRNRTCINPGHIQLVPQIENTRRDSKRIDRKATRLCLAPGCNLNVSAQFPDGFNLCRPCGGDAPTVNWIGEQIAFAFA